MVGAAILPDGLVIEGHTDSKKLSAIKRKKLEAEIKEVALSWSLGWVHADELDSIGLSAALELATKRAVQGIKGSYSEIIIDGTINFLKNTTKGPYVTTLPKADFLIPAVSAAAILAKVARDECMAQQDDIYPGYGFASHVGYGTVAHSKALEERGVTPLHRKSFAPIKRLLGVTENEKSATLRKETKGAIAESLVVAYLKKQGHEIIERNWRTRSVEVDIISKKNTVYYFTEVKYRTSEKQGGGVAAITKEKQVRMNKGALLYAVKINLPQSTQMQIAVASVSAEGLIAYITLTE